MKKIIDPCPAWLTAKLHALHELAEDSPPCYLAGATVHAILFGGTFGPMVEPLVSEIQGPAVEATLQRAARRQDGILWQAFVPQHLGALEEVLIGLEANRPTIFFPSAAAQRAWAKGQIVAPVGSPALQRLTVDYPGLQINGEPGSQVFTSHQEMTEESLQKSVTGKRLSTAATAPREWPAQVTHLVAAIQAWHRAHPPRMEWVLAPPIAACPAADPWEAEDACFRGWLVQQIARLHAPQEMAPDEIVARVMTQVTGQKGTHQGWKTWQHALQTAMQVQTVALPAHVRKAVRIAMLLHDIGKTSDKILWTAGCHAAYGAKIWKRSRISVAPQHEQVISFVIKNHDLLGLLDRSLTGKVSAATMSLAQAAARIRANPWGDASLAIQMLAAVNDADVGSLPILRYLTGLTPLLVQVIRQLV